MANLGWHYLAEFHGCDPAALNNLEKLKEALTGSLDLAGATTIQNVFQALSAQGVAGTVTTAESRASIHTWPEHGYAALDIFSSTQEISAWPVIDVMGRALQAREVETREILRGLRPEYSPAFAEAHA
jgi:S-adenosylmethionine decarboxylase